MSSAKATAAAYEDITFLDWCRTQGPESAEPWGADVNVDVDDPTINMETHPLAFTPAHAQVLRKITPGAQHASGDGPGHDCVMAVAFRRVPLDVVTLDRDDARRGRAGAAGATVLQVLVRASANGNEWDQHELPRQEGCTARAVRVQQYRARLP